MEVWVKRRCAWKGCSACSGGGTTDSEVGVGEFHSEVGVVVPRLKLVEGFRL